MDDLDTSWKDALRAELFAGWPRWASFACVWLWCCLFTRTAELALPISASLSGVSAEFLALVGTIFSLLCVVMFSKRIASVLDSNALLAVGTASFVVGSVLIIVGSGEGMPMLEVGGGICGGLSIGLLKIAWGEMYSRMPLRRGLMSMGLALLASTCCYMLIQLAPSEIIEVSLVACGAACAPLLRRGAKDLGELGGEQGAKHARPIKMSWKFLVLPSLVALTYGIVEMQYGAALNEYAAFIANTCGEAICGAALIAISSKLDRRFGAAQIYGLALIFVVLGYLMLSFGLGETWQGLAVHNLGFSAFYFFMVVFWGNLASRMGSSVVRVYAIGYFTFMLSSFVGSIFEKYVLQAYLAGFSIAVPVILIFGFFIAVLFIFGDTYSPVRIWLTGEEPAETDDRVSDACARIADVHHLTAREYEVLIILARGRNAAFIAQSLGIAYDTAKVHIKNIYSKLSIHNQQELLDLVDEQLGSQGREG